ncbi:MAG: NADH-quinone oxidoreductase subunit L [Aureliella sp.]
MDQNLAWNLAWTIPLAPLAACLVCTVMSLAGAGKKTAHLPAWLGLGISAAAAVALLWQHSGATISEIAGYQWLSIGNFELPVALQLDTLSLMQICVVTVVAWLVVMYSPGYMHGDPGYARYFAVFSAFVFAMAMLVLANNLLVLYAFWEGVGLCSYLLIGYWYQRPAAAKAAFKAFLVNRIADCGFLVGILLLWYGVGLVTNPTAGAFSRLDYSVICSPDVCRALADQQPMLLTTVGVLLLLGAIGKSAQFPLHVWLPDAMEGPTPVSALIHAATMVTAGVYLLCRMSPLLVLTPDVLVATAWIGGITALLAATIALFQDDLKRVLAYSTVSQLGYMFMGIGCGAAGEHLIGLAVMAAMFHLATHAFFKALLFLSAGNVMHAMGDVIDMRQFSGLRRVLPFTHLLFLIGAAALGGVPLLAGFWSKDNILSLLSQAARESNYEGSFTALMVIGFVTAFFTAVYTFRAYFRTFQGDERFPSEAGAHPHEATFGMLWPMGVLAIGSLGLGAALAPTGRLEHYFENIPYLPAVAHAAHGWEMLIISSVVALAGLAFAWWTVAVRLRSSALGAAVEAVASAGVHRFYIDEIYSILFVKPLEGISRMIAVSDINLVDQMWRSLVSLPERFGTAWRRVQAGGVTNYAAVMAIGLVICLIIVVMR